MHKALKIGLAVFLAATPVKWAVNQLGGKLALEPPSRSPLEARFKGTFVCKASFDPPAFDACHGKIAIREAWVERPCKLRWMLVWIPYFEKKGGYQLCFSLKEGKEFFAQPYPSCPVWTIQGAAHSVAHVSFNRNSTDVFAEVLPELPASLRLELKPCLNRPAARAVEVKFER